MLDQSGSSVKLETGQVSGGAAFWDDPRAWIWLFEQSAMMFGLSDLEGCLRRCNRGLAQFLGQTRVHENLENLAATEEYRESLIQLRDKVLETGQADQVEIDVSINDGSATPVRISLDLARDELGEPIGFLVFLNNISRRRQAERRLAESERRFRNLFDDAPFGYHEIDLDGRIVTINRTECEMVGYSREELIGKPIFDFLPESIRESARESVTQRLRGELPLLPFERIYKTRDGRELMVAIQERLVRNDQGVVVGLRSVIRDITASKQVEAALIASERRARALFEGIEDAVFVHSLDGRFLDANSAASRRLGYTREEFLQLSTKDIDEPEFSSKFGNRLEEQLRKGRLRLEGRHRTKDGRIVPVDINTTVIQFEGQPAILAVMRDMTDRLKLEETTRLYVEAQARNSEEIAGKNRELMQSEARYRQLTEGCLDAIIVADPDANITLFNPAAERTFGYSAKEILGSPLFELILGSACNLKANGGDQAKQSPELVGQTAELQGKRKSGEVFPLELSLSAVEIDGQWHYVGAVRDLTEKVKMRSMLLQSEKMASIGLLSAGVAHEINNPLAYVANNLAILERDLTGVMKMMSIYEQNQNLLAKEVLDQFDAIQDLSDDIDWPYVRDNWKRIITKTREGVQRVSNIVQSLRGLARTSNQAMETVELADLVSNPLEMVRGRIKKANIVVETHHEPAPKIHCASSQINQVILNLLVNAIQAVESVYPSSGGKIQLNTRKSGQHHIIEIQDNGPGIDPQHLDRLFDPFFTTKPVGEGTGLGLFICHEIVSAHNGRIEVSSQPGKGACFTILLRSS